MSVLSDADLEFFNNNGYCILKNAVPEKSLKTTVKAIWKFANASADNSDEWYKKPFTKIGFLEFYHHQTLWNNRQCPRIYHAFCQLWKTTKLWVGIDRLCVKLPKNPKFPDWDHDGFVHWDINPWQQPIPFSLQGVLSLEDTTEEQGGFHCVPGLVGDRLQAWLKQHTVSEAPKPPVKLSDFRGLEVKPIATKAGDLIIWMSELPHGNGVNYSSRPRMAQYIRMFPTSKDSDFLQNSSSDSEFTQERLELWRNSLGPANYFNKQPEPEQQHPAKLTSLGRKLLGIDTYR